MFEFLMLCGFFYAATSCLSADIFRGSRRREPQKVPAKKELEQKAPGERSQHRRRLTECRYDNCNSRMAA